MLFAGNLLIRNACPVEVFPVAIGIPKRLRGPLDRDRPQRRNHALATEIRHD